MSRSRRCSSTFAKFIGTAALAAAATPAGVGAQPLRDELALSSPRFVATAVSFKALDETGIDRTGSDEVHAVFADFDPIDERTTSVYQDVDAGETKNFRAADQCISPQPSCDKGKSSLRFKIGLWERDKPSFPFSGSDFCYGRLSGTHSLINKGICSGDDLIGRIEINRSQEELLAALPAVGASAEFTVKPTGGAGSYQFTYRITRLPNAERTIVIRDPPVLTPPISLQATVSGGFGGQRVTLTWSGATAANVDVYRNGAVVATVPNNGRYEEAIAAGTYQYRVCNAGSAVCSADATVVVP